MTKDTGASKPVGTLHAIVLDVNDLDVTDLEAAVQRAVGLGGTKLDEISEYGITWAVMADPDGNEFCLVQHS